MALVPPLTHLSEPSDALRGFTPNWFTVTMGTGILALMLDRLSPYVALVHSLATGIWIFNSALFATFAVLFVARVVQWPHLVRETFEHPVQAMFLGAIPMGLATIVNGFAVFGPQFFGTRSFGIAWELWIADAILSVLSGLIVPAFMFVNHDHTLERMTAVWLLPVVPAEVAAASAGFLAPHLSQTAQQTLVVAGTMLFALSVPLALAILTILFLRLALHKVPDKDLGVSGWLTLGPLGTGSLALILLGNAAISATAATPLAQLGPIAAATGLIGGLLLWAYGAWWWLIGILSTMYHMRRDLPFNMGWWAFTFPLGVFTAATYAIAGTLHAQVFLGIAMSLTLMLAMLWVLVAVRTVAGAYHGTLFARTASSQLTRRAAAELL